jgi:hypothetical protein
MKLTQTQRATYAISPRQNYKKDPEREAAKIATEKAKNIRSARLATDGTLPRRCRTGDG